MPPINAAKDTYRHSPTVVRFCTLCVIQVHQQSSCVDLTKAFDGARGTADYDSPSNYALNVELMRLLLSVICNE